MKLTASTEVAHASSSPRSHARTILSAAVVQFAAAQRGSSSQESRGSRGAAFFSSFSSFNSLSHYVSRVTGGARCGRADGEAHQVGWGVVLVELERGVVAWLCMSEKGIVRFSPHFSPLRSSWLHFYMYCIAKSTAKGFKMHSPIFPWRIGAHRWVNQRS